MSSVQSLVDAAGRPRSPATIQGSALGSRRVTRANATPRTRRRLMRSSPSCAKPAMIATAIA
jgi:hypothetical protein